MEPASPALAGGLFATEPPGKPFQHGETDKSTGKIFSDEQEEGSW